MKSDETDDNSAQRGQRSHASENCHQRGVAGLTLELLLRPADLPIDVGTDLAPQRSEHQPRPRDIIPMILRERVAGRLSWRWSSSFCGIDRNVDLMRLDLPGTTCLRCARTGSCRQFERTRDLGERCLFRFAYAHAADAKKSTLLGCFGNVLADLAQPAFEGR